MNDSKFLRIKNDDYIRLLTPIKDGLIDLPALSHGKIVRQQNQVEADIWFYDMGLQYGSNSIRNQLEVSNVRLEGLVIEVRKKDFAVSYNYKEHSNIQVDSRKLVDFPFFEATERLTKISSSWYVNNERGTEYLIDEVIDVINEGFSDWVISNLKTRKVYKYEKENGDFPEDCDRVLTDDSNNKYNEKREELEMEFARLTGLYYEFLGGLIYE